MIFGSLLLFTTLLSFFLTRQVYRYACTHLLDIPNQRSSHQVPTPRGGGLAIVISYFSFLGGIFFLLKPQPQILPVLATGLLIATLGFWDDHRAIAARWRFIIHILTAWLALYLIQGFPALQLGTLSLNFGLTGYLIGIVFLVWLLNLFNFMDGIDAIAASETIFVSMALAIFMYFNNPWLALSAAGLGASCLGFLVYNWPPAKIFMGDVGSAFLGFLLALLILVFVREQARFMAIGLILPAVFITDASYTLIYRFIDGQRWYAAHCSHAYQQLAKHKGHRYVVIAVCLINLFWLLPLATVIYYKPEWFWPGLALAYGPLLFIAYRLGAGRAVQTPHKAACLPK